VPAPLGPTDSAAAPEPAPYVPPSQAAAATTAPAAPHPADQPRVVLSATADAWMQVRDKSGQVLLNRVLHPGEFWAVPAQPSLVLTTGNAGGTDILVDGATMPPLGASGAVRRDIPLDPDLLKTGKIPSASLPMTTASSAGSSMGSSGASSASPMVPAIAPRSASQ
jgi:cytoskeleton protein RodZ